MQKTKLSICFVSTVLLGSLSACSSNTVKDARDPMEHWNRQVQSINDRADDYVFKPVAKGYNAITPDFVDKSISNLFANLNDIGVMINDLLQFKIAQSGLDCSRFLVNTVAGVGGLVDVASMLELPKHKEDFDQTLAVWGVPSGSYLVLPLLGSSTPRAIVGRIGDAALSPITYVGFGVMGLSSGGTATAISAGSSGLKTIDARSDHLGTEKVVNEAATDRYEFMKNAYFQQREYLITDGQGLDKNDVLDVMP
jgi:phospholipid-binding lipoprotein MlaA